MDMVLCGWPRKWRWNIGSFGERGISTTAGGLMSIEQVLVKWKLLERAVEDLLRLMS